MNSITSQYAATFIDFENIFHYLRRRFVDNERTLDCTMELVRNLREHLLLKHEERPIIQHAYADFEQIEVAAQGALYLNGIETHHVLGTDHKNAADMRLSIDVLETLYTRPEIQTFVFVAGDRDYIPVIQHLKKHARKVRTVAFKDNISGDLLMNVGDGYIDAVQLLNKVSMSELEVGETRIREERKARPVEAVGKSSVMEQVLRELPRDEPIRLEPKHFSKAQQIYDNNVLLAIEMLLTNFGDKSEVWFTPYLNLLRSNMQGLAEYERKALISTMEDYGAVKVEKRRGEPHDYSVILINWNHPNVRELNPLGKS